MVRLLFFVTFAIGAGIAVQALPSVAAGQGSTPQSWSDGLSFADASTWTKGDGWANGSPFDVGWRADHVTFGRGQMTLTLDT